MLKFKSISITNANLFCWILTILLISSVFTVFFVYQKFMDFDEKSKNYRKDSLASKKKMLKREVESLSAELYRKRNPKTRSTPETNPEKNSIQEQALKDIRRMTFGKGNDGYIFVIDFQGNVLLHPTEWERFEKKNIKDLSNGDGVKPFDPILLAKEKQFGAFTIYSLDKSLAINPGRFLSYVKPLPNFQWFICATLPYEKKEELIQANRKRLQIDLLFDIGGICLLAIIITLAAVRISFLFSKSIKKEIDTVIKYFRKASSGGIIATEEDFRFRELKFISSSALRMIAQRQKLEDQLREANDKLRDMMERAKAMAIQSEIGSKAKSRFLSNMNHEIRNPMNSILGMARFLEETSLDEKQSGYLESILSSSRNLVTLVNDIRDFATIESDRIKIAETAFNLEKIAPEIIDYLAKTAERKGIELKLHISSETPEYVIGDSEKIKQILTDLVENGITFTQNGFVEIYIDCEGIVDDKSLVYFKVTDTGSGISPEDLDSIFDFTNERIASSSKESSAIALRLAVCKHLVESMDGEISAKSEKDKGSVLAFYLPLKLADEETIKDIKNVNEAERKKHEEAKKHPAKDLNILVAEDDSANQRIAVMLLKRITGVTNVDVADNGKEAVEKTKTSSYNMIFMDCDMPEMNGLEATEMIREMEGENKHTPIVALTADTLADDKERCFEVGMDDHLSKPFTLEMLQEAVEKHVY